MSTRISGWVPVLSLVVLTASLVAQEPAATETKASDAPPKKRPIAPEDYGRWESLGFRSQLSPDGRWLAYSVRRVNGKNELRVRMLATDSKEVFPYATGARFSGDSNWLGFMIGVSEEERERLQKSGQPVQRKLGLHDLTTGKTSEIENVASFSFSDDGKYLVLRRPPLKGRKSSGADIVVRNLATGVDTGFGNVASYRFNDDGTLLAMLIDAEANSGNGVQLYDAVAGTLRTLDSANTRYKSLSWREDSTDLAAMRVMKDEEEQDEDDGKKKDGDGKKASKPPAPERKEPSHEILTWKNLAGGTPRLRAYDHRRDETFPERHRIVDTAGLRWSDDGTTVFFGIKELEEEPKEEAPRQDEPAEKPTEEKPKPKVEIFDEGGGDSKESKKPKKPKAKSLRETLKDPAGVDVWHARDVDIIPLQKRVANREKRRSHLSAWWIEDDRFVQLGNELTENVSLMEGQKTAIGTDNTPYDEERRFGPTLVDAYFIDVATGEARRVLDGSKYRLGSSPDGRHMLYVKDDHIWVADVETLAHRNITEGIDTHFINQEVSALTDEKPPYGVTGWSEDGRYVFLNDRYDIWKISIDGSGAERLTRGAEERVRHRRQILDFEEEEFIDPARPFYVSLYGDRTKKSGYGRLRVGDKVERLIWRDKSIGGLVKAEDAAVLAFAEQSFDDSPDIFVTDGDFAAPRRATDTNPFQKEFLWGRGELIDYDNEHGEDLQGALYYPADYEAGKQYPMIVDIYELRSQGLHRYSTPSERSAYNAAVFTAHGYFVYTPDIVYRPQNPGLSAAECVIPAVKAVLAKGVVDPKRIGLVGHSWGAYQTAFLVTHCEVFAAGVAGAPLTNMMSMSMSIYWNTGQTDAWIFHESQGRMDRPFWQDVETYIKNSPIFGIDDMDTPLLIAFGDKDGAVDWHQGIEMYNAARLAQKQLVMLVYEGENHGLRLKPNQVDYHYRILEWFGHYLKGDEAPKWIIEGTSFLEREKELEAKKKPSGAGRGAGPRGRRGNR